MAIQGFLGSVQVGAVPEVVGSAKAWSIDMSTDTTDVTTFADGGWKASCAGIRSWTGSITVVYTAGEDTGEAALIDAFQTGAEVALELLTGAVGSGTAEKFTGQAVITGMPVVNDVNSCLEVQFAYEGAGALTIAALVP